MGEKEITPAGPGGPATPPGPGTPAGPAAPSGPATPAGPMLVDPPVPGTSGVASDGSSTVAGPGGGGGSGTGQDKKTPPPPPSGRTSSWDGSVQFPDGYRMGRQSDGTTYLNHPDGSTATWDGQNWSDPSGKPTPTGWSGGHQPTDYGPAS